MNTNYQQNSPIQQFPGFQPKQKRFNNIKNRYLFLSPQVQAGLEREATVTDFIQLTKLGQGSYGEVYKV